MIKNIKYMALLLAISVCGYIGFNMYQYFYDRSVPEIQIVGIDDGKYYAGDIVATLTGKHPYKIQNFSLWLDDVPVVTDFKVNANKLHYPLSIPVQNVQDGQHTLKIKAIDGTYHEDQTVLERTFHTDNVGLQASFVKPDSEHRVFQGRCLHIHFQVNKPVKQAVVKALAQEFPCFPEANNSLIYEAFIPVKCEAQPSEYLFTVDLADEVGNTYVLENKLQVMAFPFKKKVVHIDTKVVDAEKAETEQTEYDFEDMVEQLTKNSVQKKMWDGSFYVPLNMTAITTDFGLVRTTQHKGRYAHKAVDLISAAPKSVVWAAQDGIVVMKDRYQHAGKTVIIDHGFGVLSMYFHLDDYASIEVGQKIRRGQPIGTMGKTGYAKGYHLHWELRVNNIPVDPMQWTKKDF